MFRIDISKYPGCWNNDTKTFSMSEVGIPFGTEYEVFNPANNSVKEFKFTHSTGPEYASTTRYVYKCEDMLLEICNDPEITKINAAAYLAAKTRK